MGATLAVVAMAIWLPGCGGGSSSSADSDAAKPAEFLGPGENGKLAQFGEEADAADREAASTVLEENLKARAARDFARQCSSLTAAQIQFVEEQQRKSGCAKTLKGQAQTAPPNVLAYTMTGPIDLLRVKGNRGFALYHGTKGKDYAMPMVKEGGEWKVDSLTTRQLPSSQAGSE